MDTTDSPPSRRLRRGALVRELRSWPTLVLVLCCLFVGIPIAILLTPNQEIVAVGQHLSVGARTPSLSISGPAQVVQIGNTEFDIPRLQVYGPLRPQLVIGPVQRNAAAAAVFDPATTHQAQTHAINTLGNGFRKWYAWGAFGLVCFVLAAAAVASCIRILITLRRQTHTRDRRLTVAEIWHRSIVQIRWMTVIALVAALLGWGTAGALAYSGAVRGLQGVTSLSQLVGNYHLSPSPVGPPVHGYAGAVIGDSRASRVGGPPVEGATADDVACQRSSDSLAHEIGRLVSAQVLNLSCAGASIASGLRGPQQHGERQLPPQVGKLKQVAGLQFVVVVIGPNDVSWVDFMTYCYIAANCSDNLTQGEFAYRLAAFDKEYGNLLQDLNGLPGAPQIIVVTSYDVFKPGADCPDARGPAQAKGLNDEKITLLSSWNDALNSVLTSGAEKYRFDVVNPALTPLCQPSHDQLGPDIQGLDDSNPFHPTGLGTIRMAASVARFVIPD
ncbi:MAG TPA: hypothetical protein VFQ77_00405 [Pseudonocardiaceae bacterium]|nr:hypothetical protein [Pseudonocardiaceae bacterium]